MNELCPYKNFSNYILRVPVLSFTLFQKLTKNIEISDEELRLFCSSPIIKESIFIASSSLYKELEKWLADYDYSVKKNEKLKLSLLKYISRMCSRCTPYGLFAGVAVGKFDSYSKIELDNLKNNSRKTRLDMHYLIQLSQNLALIPSIKKQVKYYSNTSIYKVGDKIRYVEYKYINDSRVHQLLEVDQSDYLSDILCKSKDGILISDLFSILIDYGANENEANDFIDELLASQLIISEMEPSISGPDILDQIILILEGLDNVDEIVQKLLIIKLALNNIDQTFGNEIQKYDNVKELIMAFIRDQNNDSLFQTDLAIRTKDNFLNQEIINSLIKGFVLLNKLTPSIEQKSVFTQFKKAFYKRYEDQEVSLAHALDNEIGIGYVQNYNSDDINPLIDNINFSENNIYSDIFLTKEQLYFCNLIKESHLQNKYSIRLLDKDFTNLAVKWNDFPQTLSFPVQILKDNENFKIKFKHGASQEAADLLSRFCHVDSELNEYVMEIVKTESELRKGQIIAEIIHLPESRIGNVLMRPDFREYEIPYLNKSIKNKQNQIFIEDLMISMKENNIVLRCKRNNREVFPKLTSAHNFSYNSLPIYQFLSDFKNQGTRYGVNLDLESIHSIFDFIPRIEYENIILNEATWFLKYEQIKSLLKNLDDDKFVYTEMQKIRSSLSIPQYVLLIEGDNELLINLENLTCIKMLLTIVKNKKRFKIAEFLYVKESLVRKENEHYTNEVIIGFYNDRKFNKF